VSFWKIFRGNKKYVEQERKETAHQALVAEAMILTMACIAEADGRVDDAELAKMAQVYGRVTGTQAEPDRIQAVVEDALKAKGSIEELLLKRAKKMESTDKANLIHAGVLIAIVDDNFDVSEQSEIWRLGNALGVSSKGMKDIIKRAKKAY